MGYGPQIGVSREGHPVFLYVDPQSNTRTYVVVLPDGRAFYSDEQGRITVPNTGKDNPLALALAGGALGLLFGEVPGALIGFIAGAILGRQISKKPGG